MYRQPSKLVIIDILEYTGAIGGLHLLPVYPSSGDGGFAPLTYKDIDPEMGTWEDIERLSKKYELLMECMYAINSILSSNHFLSLLLFRCSWCNLCGQGFWRTDFMQAARLLGHSHLSLVE